MVLSIFAKASISLDAANQILRAAEAEAATIGIASAVTVVDLLV